MNKTIFKLLTFTCLFAPCRAGFAQYIEQTENNDFFRLAIHSEAPEQLIVRKKGSTVEIKTLNMELFDKIVEDMKKISLNKKYFSNFNVLEPNSESNVPSIVINLSQSSVELFSFYKDREKKKVIDFWIDADAVGTKEAATAPAQVAKAEPKKVVVKTAVKKEAPVQSQKIAIPSNNDDFKDFRYGASFIWDYEPLSPRIVKPLNLERKTPEYFYPIKERDFKKSEKEAHLQLAINLYNKKKWGLMYKSITLFQKKYGDEEQIDLIEYLKANAILREELEKGKTKPVKMAISMFQNIVSRTKDYDMRKGVSKYLLAYYFENKEYVQSLDLAKKLYVDSKENFDYEQSDSAAEYILFSLANLNQVEQVKQLVSEKTIQKLLPKQVLMAYEMFSMMKLGEVEETIKYFEKVEKTLTKPRHEAILYNAAEAYFRMGNYDKAVRLYDDFLAEHSYHIKSSEARLRIALSYDLLERDPYKVEELYKNAINRSQIPDISYEARIRYVGHRSVRKKKIDNSDREIRVFLDNDNIEKLDKDLKKLLWLTRLRIFIKDQKFEEALSFLSALPLKTMKEEERRVYEADGAEIVYGIIEHNFKASEYAKSFRAYEIYKDTYVNKVATDPYLNYIVAKSLLKLKLTDQFEKFMTHLRTLKDEEQKTFPIWVERNELFKINDVIGELTLLKNLQMGEWDEAEKSLAKVTLSNELKKFYFSGLIDYNLKKYASAEEAFEKYMTAPGARIATEPIEVAELLKAYTDSIYEQGKSEKFKKVARALLDDTESLKGSNTYVQGVRERLQYLYLEMTGAELKPDFVTFSKDITAFKKDYPSSQYQGRINYLQGMMFVKEGKFKEGRLVFEEILKDSESSEYLKEMVRAELSLLQIKERKI
ncbi:hypothetical protein M899_1283 [Bacteriovorax sp. BSW11_IV]|uniref:tetratricopeptide repeat protein n=1 Tax=Bacteriovorax sp. BSW11_IV TaxID=1353529 RepID=UPI00038A32FE|nr:tetratricopeptide repeat protein [Bacteriovorax sp. BSW11_IV]EQC45909.1 hypothetical protein M899_1283 [Bacteriovorax sp. BSW11_IV]